MKSIYKGITFLLLLTSCSDDYPPVFMGKIPTYIQFEKTYDLMGELTPIETIGIANLHVLDTFLIFSTPGLDTLYQAYSSNDLKRVGSFIRKGDGPNELGTALKPLSGERKENDMIISFYNKERRGIFHFNLTKSLNQGTDVFLDTLTLEDHTEIYRAYQLTQDEIFIDNLDFINLNQLFSVYRLTDRYITQLDTAVLSGLHDQGEIFLMATCTIFNKSIKKYAGGMIFLDQLNIYDINNPAKSLAVTVNNKPSSLIAASRMFMSLKKEFYVDLRESKLFLFGLYANQTRKEWATGDRPGEIHVITWEGQPVCKLSTKEKLVQIDIDPIHNVLYGFTEGDELFRYDLRQIPDLN
jgi:hypothetical protein